MEPLDLSEIPETMLWNLFHRASEAARPDAVLADPVGEELLGRLGDDLTARFGEANPLLAQAQALRAARFDGEVRRFLSANPNGTVAALGEGLETQFWRTDNGAVDWVSVDLGEAIDARRRLLPASDRLVELSFPRGRGLLYGRLLPLLGRRRPRPIGYLAPWSILRAEFSRP
jgi:O-methyltransferase involved in polyketide biosynthesis